MLGIRVQCIDAPLIPFAGRPIFKQHQKNYLYLIMKLLLTSGGVTNPGIYKALVGLLGKPIEACKALFVPTAIYPFNGGAHMAYNAILGNGRSPLVKLGWKSLGVLELTTLPGLDKGVWLPQVEEADALLVWGGDPVYLAHWMQQSGLAELLPTLNLVYIGVSAGSMATSATVGETYRNPPVNCTNVLTSEDMVFAIPEGTVNRKFITAHGVGFVDFALIPHYGNPEHPDASVDNAAVWAAKLPVPVYAIDG